MILLVEPDKIWQEILAERLKRQGLLVRACETGCSAWQKAHKKRPHLVVLELNIPDMSGLDLVRRFRASAEFFNLDIIALASCDSRELASECLKEGVNFYLPKSEVGISQTLFTINSFIKRRTVTIF